MRRREYAHETEEPFIPSSLVYHPKHAKAPTAAKAAALAKQAERDDVRKDEARGRAKCAPQGRGGTEKNLVAKFS